MRPEARLKSGFYPAPPEAIDHVCSTCEHPMKASSPSWIPVPDRVTRFSRSPGPRLRDGQRLRH